VNSAHFEPLSQDLDTSRPIDEEHSNTQQPSASFSKGAAANVEPVEVADIAGTAHR
jgi:hypothetical protein